MPTSACLGVETSSACGAGAASRLATYELRSDDALGAAHLGFVRCTGAAPARQRRERQSRVRNCVIYYHYAAGYHCYAAWLAGFPAPGLLILPWAQRQWPLSRRKRERERERERDREGKQGASSQCLLRTQSQYRLHCSWRRYRRGTPLIVNAPCARHAHPQATAPKAEARMVGRTANTRCPALQFSQTARYSIQPPTRLERLNTATYSTGTRRASPRGQHGNEGISRIALSMTQPLSAQPQRPG